MGYYVKVTKEVAEQILKKGVKATITKDGNRLLWQSELNGLKGVNLLERVKNVGGALLTAQEAREETNGSGHAHCYTPIEYGGNGDVESEQTVVLKNKEDGNYGYE